MQGELSEACPRRDDHRSEGRIVQAGVLTNKVSNDLSEVDLSYLFFPAN